MALRTDATKVTKLIEKDAEAWEGCDASDFETCMTCANVLVTRHCTSIDPATGLPYNDDTSLELIERWLSAHFVGCIDASVGRLTVAQVASLREQYSFKVDLGLNATIYGQQAIAMDGSMGLARIPTKLQQKRVARVKHLGSPIYTYGKVPPVGWVEGDS